jgi:hypothetical protein
MTKKKEPEKPKSHQKSQKAKDQWPQEEELSYMKSSEKLNLKLQLDPGKVLPKSLKKKNHQLHPMLRFIAELKRMNKVFKIQIFHLSSL